MSVGSDLNGLAVAVVMIVGSIGAAVALVVRQIGTSKRELLEAQIVMHRENVRRIDQQDAKADEIHDLVNGNAHEAAKREEALQKRLGELKAQIVTMHGTIATLQEARVQDAKTNGK